MTPEYVEADRAVLPRRLGPHALPAVLLVLFPVLVAAYDFNRYGRSVRMVDEYFYHAHARSWYFDGDCDYDNDILMAPGFRLAPMYAEVRSATGRLFNHFTIGTAITSFACLAIGDVMTVAHNALSAAGLPRDGYSRYYQMAVGFGHTLLGVVGLLAAYVLACRYFSARISALAVLAVLLGTNALYYIAIESTHSHADSIAWVAILLLLTDTVYRNGLKPLRGLLLGLAAGLMVATRAQDAAWGLVPVIVLTPMWISSILDGDTRGRALTFAVMALAGAFVAYAPQLWVNHELHGTWLFNAYRAVEVQGHPAVLHWSDPDFLRPILDPSVGLLWTAPLVLLTVPAILRSATAGWREVHEASPPTIPALALAALAMYYIVACVWWTFTGFGHRYLSSCTTAYVLGLCLVFSWASQRRRRVVVMAVLAIACVGYEVGLLIAASHGLLVNRAPAPLHTWVTGGGS